MMDTGSNLLFSQTAAYTNFIIVVLSDQSVDMSLTIYIGTYFALP